MPSLQSVSSLDIFFEQKLPPALKRRNADLSLEALAHVIHVLVRFSHQEPTDSEDPTPCLETSLDSDAAVYIRGTYNASQRNPKRLLALADTCLYRLGFCYASALAPHNLHNPSSYAHIGAASYARVAELFLDYGNSEYAVPFLELAHQFDPVTLALADIHFDSLTDQQLVELYGIMRERRDSRYRSIFQEKGFSVPSVTHKKDASEQRTVLYIGPPGSSDNN